MLWPIALAIIVAVFFWATRQNELFYVSIRNGRALVVRGRIPASLLSDFRDALARQQVQRATLRAFRDAGGARLEVSGQLDDFQAQRLRNIFHTYPISNLRAAPPLDHRSVGQWLGIPWLAWFFHRPQ